MERERQSYICVHMHIITEEKSTLTGVHCKQVAFNLNSEKLKIGEIPTGAEQCEHSCAVLWGATA